MKTVACNGYECKWNLEIMRRKYNQVVTLEFPVDTGCIVNTGNDRLLKNQRPPPLPVWE
ncbi:hypothetical protein JWG42_07735 [Desulfoprunum benzoelyticum]|uniref:Uncharacterized protein n=1 Tax=Desulfoprunum benzoelyticum TaxID=1506996 RepID=A0A840UV20_9BACT|nr:hypothetical protein [Desulfoprunum benzoelyticum]MBB5348686.1 hypothetical protein [Desulfoprunum benzoelyticum]MBM9530036.1 hypothetical protein [Desulfoprunum benzoelyticum]